MKNGTLKDHVSHYAKAFVPAKVVQSRLHKRTYMNFADKMGLVYFGYVDQRSDEHRLVRGLTVSATHRDNHYCIGSYKGYDVTLVERTDTIRFPGKAPRTQEWLIMAFDLRSADLPHVFVGLHTHSDTFYAHLFLKFATLARAPLGTFTSYDGSFMNKYAVYTEPARAGEAEQLIDSQTARQIADHFGTLTFEIADDCLYLYAWHPHPTETLLNRMLQNGAWLASVIDARA